MRRWLTGHDVTGSQRRETAGFAGPSHSRLSRSTCPSEHFAAKTILIACSSDHTNHSLHSFAGSLSVSKRSTSALCSYRQRFRGLALLYLADLTTLLSRPLAPPAPAPPATHSLGTAVLRAKLSTVWLKQDSLLHCANATNEGNGEGVTGSHGYQDLGVPGGACTQSAGPSSQTKAAKNQKRFLF